MPDQNWQFELEEYIKQGEPDRAEKSEAWQTAIGLQAVDGLNTSAYLLDTAKDHIEGKITIDEAQQRIHSYYEQRTTRTEIENETKEADIVSARIAKLLGEKTFQFSPAEWITIHRRLFEGVFDHAGQIRKYNISKKEWILNGETVIYADFNSIKDTLDYDFATEKQFSYEGLSVEASVKHLAKFASDIWQIHPFGEGNTRATAVFMIKYMKTFGFRVNNDAFRENSWYFRNALVRANYNDLQKGIHSTTKFLELFFSNLLLGTNYELKNRYMHVDFVDENTSQSAKSETPKCQIEIFCPLADSWHIETPEEKVRQEYIKILVENYGYSLDQMAQEIKVNNSQRGQGKARADIVIWKSKQDKIESKAAFIVVECKAENVRIREEDYYQGYNNGLTLLSVVSPFSLYKNQFSNHRSRYTYSDTIHLLHPLHLVGGFELFRDTFLFGVFFYQPRKEGLCFFLYIGEVGM